MTNANTQAARAQASEAPTEELTLGEQIRKWFFRASIAGMVLSLVIHVVLFIIAAVPTTLKM